MKKILALILAILLLTGCAATYNGPTETVRVLTAQEMVMNGQTRRTEMAYDIFGNCITTRYYTDGKLTAVHERTFDESGRQLTEATIDRSGLLPKKLSEIRTAYDEQGRTLTVTALDGGGRELERTEYIYDGTTVTKTIHPSGLSTVSEYDGEGRLQRTFRADSSTESVHSYDENGNRTATHSFRDGRANGWTKWEYDHSGRVIACTTYDADGVRTEHYTCTYDDDARTMTQRSSDGTRRVEEYDEDGNILYAESYDAAEKLTMTMTYTYEDIQAAVQEETP